MKQALLYSIAPQHLVNILNGLKTIEVRKRDLPQWAKDKLARGEKVEGYGYCTKAEPILCHFNNSYYDTLKDDNTLRVIEKVVKLNGRVVVKFEVSGVGKIDNEPSYHDDWLKFGKQACLDEEQWYQYFTWSKDGGGYAHHLTNIQPVNMELREFFNDCGRIDTDEHGREIGWHDVGIGQITKAPKSFQSVWVKS